MLDVVLGAILGTAASLAIAHGYYRRSTRAFEAQVAALRDEITRLQAMSRELQDAAEVIQRDLEVTTRRVVAGTPDDPEYAGSSTKASACRSWAHKASSSRVC